ncbi:MAG TPA: protease complex subunit PrcB family protein [Limnochordia bacterium]
MISTRAAWERLWETLWQPGPRPYVDFDRQIVLAVFGGEQRSGGHRVEIIGVQARAAAPAAAGGGRAAAGSTVDAGVIDVTVLQEGPAPGRVATLVLTYPGHLVLIERSAVEASGARSVRFWDQDGACLAALSFS